MKVTIHKSKANGVVIAPPSKSYAHRLILLAFIQNRKCIVNNVSLSDDIRATLDCVKALGGSFYIEDDKVIFDGNNKRVSGDITLECNESGSTLRFLIPIALALYPNIYITMHGSEKLLSRGLSIYEEIFDNENIKYEHGIDTFRFKGELRSDYYKVLGNVSSQFITGLVFGCVIQGGKFKNKRIEIIKPIESKTYIDITIDCFKMFKANISYKNGIIDINDSSLSCDNVTIEGDYSNASFFEALNYIDSNNKVLVKGLNEDSIQGDKAYIEYFKELKERNCIIDIKDSIDLGPILFVVSSMLNGGEFINTNRLINKESDRIYDLIQELKKFGCDIVVNDNEVIINKAILHTPSLELDGHNDHRIVMALSVMLTKFGGNINNAESVNKSFPDFFTRLGGLGIKYEFDK